MADGRRAARDDSPSGTARVTSGLSGHRTTGERVELRELTPDDVSERYVQWLNDPAVNAYLESRFRKHSLESVRNYVAELAGDGDNVLFGIFGPPAGVHIGNLKLGPVDRRHASAEVGLLIGERDEWGKGLASEAIALVTRYAFEELGLQKLTAGCYEPNDASRRAFEKAGWRIEGRRESQYEHEGRRVAELLLGVAAS